MISPTLQALLDRLPPADRLEFATLLEAIDGARFTGPLLINFLNGKPRQISLGQPITLTICEADLPGRLDKPKRSGSG